MANRDICDELSGYSLTTAEILYRLPDYPAVLQSYVWQDYDLHPNFPRLHKFLAYWRDNLEGSLFHIRVANARLLTPREVRCVREGLFLN